MLYLRIITNSYLLELITIYYQLIYVLINGQGFELFNVRFKILTHRHDLDSIGIKYPGRLYFFLFLFIFIFLCMLFCGGGDLGHVNLQYVIIL